MYYSHFTLTALLAGAHGATLPLFHPWNASEWIASDDTVRGGLSRSSLEVIPPGAPGNPSGCEPIASFVGSLDYEALNGSGFASQRTVDGWPGVDLSAYDRLVVEVPYTDGKTYTINVKDTVLPAVNGVEQATVSWEHDFRLPARDATAADDYDQVVVMFEDLVPTFRGRVQNDTEPLNLAGIKRFNIMIRSFFGQESQAGDFELRIKSILAADSESI
ncbi:cia30 family protein [Diaporthe eres]|uniref:NADH:ubiquinone oxidoreductase intermediate-associated protein 30 domain-containing protein n=1 Tax=Diaporthe vaccinii TaxID=105482 RepID=A0ABR4FDI8_9PEZI|nr:cia30 family protein [Diaporthe eres]